MDDEGEEQTEEQDEEEKRRRGEDSEQTEEENNLRTIRAQLATARKRAAESVLPSRLDPLWYRRRATQVYLQDRIATLQQQLAEAQTRHIELQQKRQAEQEEKERSIKEKERKKIIVLRGAQQDLVILRLKSLTLTPISVQKIHLFYLKRQVI